MAFPPRETTGRSALMAWVGGGVKFPRTVRAGAQVRGAVVSDANLSPPPSLSFSGPSSTSSLDTGLLVQAGQGVPVPFVPFGCAVRRSRALSSSCADCEGFRRERGGPTPAEVQRASRLLSSSLPRISRGGWGRCGVSPLILVSPSSFVSHLTPTTRFFSKWATFFVFVYCWVVHISFHQRANKTLFPSFRRPVRAPDAFAIEGMAGIMVPILFQWTLFLIGASAFICTADLPTNCSSGQRSNKKTKVLAAHAGARLFHMISSREPCLDFLCRDINCSYTLVAKGTTPPLVGQTALQESQLHNYEKGLCYFSSRFVGGPSGMLPTLSPGSAGCEHWKINKWN